MTNLSSNIQDITKKIDETITALKISQDPANLARLKSADVSQLLELSLESLSVISKLLSDLSAALLARRKLLIVHHTKDTSYLERVKVHLQPLKKRLGLDIDIWNEIRAEYSKATTTLEITLAQTKIAIVLISADYFDTDTLESYLLEPLLSLSTLGEVIFFPIIVNPCSFEKNSILRDIAPLNAGFPQKIAPLTLMEDNERENLYNSLTELVEGALL